MWEIAPEFRALLVFAEHRYYGESMPYGNGSFADNGRLGYLTSQQALADYVDLIAYLKRWRHDDGTTTGRGDQHRHRHKGQLTHHGGGSGGSGGNGGSGGSGGGSGGSGGIGGGSGGIGGGGARPATADRGNRSSAPSNPTIAFGGSYGGMLAAWFRLKYPAVIEGSVGYGYRWSGYIY